MDYSAKDIIEQSAIIQRQNRSKLDTRYQITKISGLQGFLICYFNVVLIFTHTVKLQPKEKHKTVLAFLRFEISLPQVKIIDNRIEKS